MRSATTPPATSCRPRTSVAIGDRIRVQLSRGRLGAEVKEREVPEPEIAGSGGARDQASRATGRQENEATESASYSSDGAGHLQHGQERFLRNVHAADALHAPLAFFLLLQQLAFTRNIAAVAFRQDVFAYGADGLARDDAAADGRLQRHFKHLPRDQFAQAT